VKGGGKYYDKKKIRKLNKYARELEKGDSKVKFQSPQPMHKPSLS
jgi:hypothetical protein